MPGGRLLTPDPANRGQTSTGADHPSRLTDPGWDPMIHCEVADRDSRLSGVRRRGQAARG